MSLKIALCFFCGFFLSLVNALDHFLVDMGGWDDLYLMNYAYLDILLIITCCNILIILNLRIFYRKTLDLSKKNRQRQEFKQKNQHKKKSHLHGHSIYFSPTNLRISKNSLIISV
jgi:hypothetical protein